MLTKVPLSRGGLRTRAVDDTGGSVTVLAVVFFVMLMAVGGLAIDLQRLYGVHEQMQTYVDNVALAAAAELDKQSGAMTRSFRAAVGDNSGGPLVTGPANSAPFATTTTLAVERVTFLSQIDIDPGPTAVTPTANEIANNWVLCTWENGTWTPANCSTNANFERVAKFVEIKASPRTVSYIVLPVADAVGSLMGASSIVNQATVQLRATAGFRAQVCDITPLMICNPDEPLGNTNTLYPYTPVVGQQILMKESSNTGSAAWAPGDFGLVDVPSDAGGTLCSGGGANAIRCMLGLVNPLTQCIDNDNVNVRPGQAQSTNQGLNVRFDIYEGNMNGNVNNPNFAPSANVTKGVCRINGGNCNYNGGNACSNLNQMEKTPTTPATKFSVRLPRDANLQADGDNGSVRFGSSTWAGDPSCAAGLSPQECYWSINHTGTLPPGLANATRYQMYRYEIDNNLVPDKSATNGENGNKACSTAPPINNPNRDRRTLTMAVVNCIASDLRGNNSNQVVKAIAYVKMFLTEPVGLNAAGRPASISNVYGEVIETVKPNDTSGVYRLQPILYR